MKFSNLKLAMFSLFVCVAFSLFLTSCNKDPLENPVAPEILSVQELPVNDSDVQEYIRLQSSFYQYVSSLSQTQLDRLLKVRESEDYNAEETFDILGLELEEAMVFGEKLNFIKENLQEKYPGLGFHETSMPEFLKEMNVFLPGNISSRDPLQDCLNTSGIGLLLGNISCLYGYEPGQAQNQCYAEVYAIYTIYVSLCYYNHG